MNLPPDIVVRIREVLAGPCEFAIDREARSHDAIALMGTVGTIWMLRPDGTFWEADEDWGLPFRPLASELELTALVVGSERYPWLTDLLPRRRLEDEDCTTCRGRGSLVSPNNISPDAKGVLCPDCHALGWRHKAG